MYAKLGKEKFEEILKKTFKNESQEENKEDMPPFDDVKVQKILQLVVPPVKKAAAAPVKKDFRAFIQ